MSIINKTYLTLSSEETRKIGRKLAEKIVSCSKKTLRKENAFLIALQGDLGGGKTTFLQGFAKGLGIKEKILSPTFVILKKFQVLVPRFQCFYHLDCYRIKSPKEILELGFKDITSDPRNIIAVEWSERIKKILPKELIVIKFEFKGENKRKIIIKKID